MLVAQTNLEEHFPEDPDQRDDGPR